jgi:uncharacterized membrane protein
LEFVHLFNKLNLNKQLNAPKPNWQKQVIGTEWKRISLIGTHIIQGNMEHTNYWASGRAHIIDKCTIQKIDPYLFDKIYLANVLEFL